MTPRWQVKDAERFWRRVRKTECCWVWTGCRLRTGYGHFKVAGRVVRAHRFAWEEVHWPIADGLHVCHRCDNPACVNPAHLFLGTHEENMRDMARKNRAKSWPGALNPRAVLTADRVALIRSSTEPRRLLAQRFGVSLSLISAVRNHRVWP